MSGTTSSQLPLRTIAHILEYLFWEAPCKYSNTADLRKAPGALPIGHFALLQVLQVNHHWRKPAVWLFYGTAAIVLDPQKQQSTILEEFEHTTDLQRRKARTNIQLLLNSGYAPKTMRLLIYAKSPIPSAPLLADAVEASGFALFEWPGINTLYLYDPWVVGDGKGGDNQWGHDQALARLNRRLALSLPALQNINALSATCDSFGLFSLDDLVAARQPQLRSLEAWGTPPNPMRLLQTQISDPLLPPLELTRLVLRVPDGQAAMEVPRTVAQSLEVLEVGPIAPDAIWSPFLSSTSTDFAHLRCLRLHFAPETTLAPQHGRRHHRHTSSRSSTLEDAVAAGAYPLFPVLQHLELIGYAWNAARFLENFPRAHLRRLCLRDCPIETVEALSLSSFVCLESASIDFICSLDASEMDESRLEDWIEQTLLTDHPSLLSLSVTIPRCLLTDDLEVSLPAERCVLTNLRSLTLDIGLRLDELEELLLSLPHLRQLRVCVSEVHTNAHEYLSRRARPNKYPRAGKKRSLVLSESVELLGVRFADDVVSGRHRRRALAKTAWLAARIPSVLRLETQAELAPMLRECVRSAAATKKAPEDTEHLACLQVVGTC